MAFSTVSMKKDSDLRRGQNPFNLLIVHLTGLEPARVAPPDSKSGVSANFTTGA